MNNFSIELYVISCVGFGKFPVFKTVCYPYRLSESIWKFNEYVGWT